MNSAMKKITSFLCIAVALLAFVACGHQDAEKEQQTENQQETPQYSAGYQAAVECISAYEAAIAAAKDCAQLDSAAGEFFVEQSQIVISDRAEVEQVKELVHHAQLAHTAKFEELGCMNYEGDSTDGEE